MRAHVRALRATECFARTRIVLIPEANLANEAQEIGEEFVGWNGTRVLSSGQREYGVWTSDTTKKMYVFRFDEKLNERGVRARCRAR